MGVGTPTDLVECILNGIDLFDCVMPTRNARNGQLLTRNGPINIKRAQFAEDIKPPDPACQCYTCQNFSRAYLRHLYVSREILGMCLNTFHNLHFFLKLFEGARNAILNNRFSVYKKNFLALYEQERMVA